MLSPMGEAGQIWGIWTPLSSPHSGFWPKFLLKNQITHICLGKYGAIYRTARTIWLVASVQYFSISRVLRKCLYLFPGGSHLSGVQSAQTCLRRALLILDRDPASRSLAYFCTSKLHATKVSPHRTSSLPTLCSKNVRISPYHRQMSPVWYQLVETKYH